jgi:ankyrin repeat protein
MIQNLLAAKDAFVATEVDVTKQDRLGRTVFHLAAQLGFISILKELQNDTLLALQDLEGFTAIHYAIEFKQVLAFTELLTRLRASPRLFEQVNTEDNEFTLASYCVLKQSWQCFAALIQEIGLASVLNETSKISLSNNLPIHYAEETD